MILRTIVAIVAFFSLLFFTTQSISNLNHYNFSDNQSSQTSDTIDQVKPIINNVAIDSVVTNLSFFIAGIDNKNFKSSLNLQSETFLNHRKAVDQAWAKLSEKRLDKMKAWRTKELSRFDDKSHNLLYTFGGPDFLNAHLCFPKADTLILMGLEPIGELPALDDFKNQSFAKNYLNNIRNALSEIFNRNYFITFKMKSALGTSVKGVLPILIFFIARSNCDIISINKFSIGEEGEIVFEDANQRQIKNNAIKGVLINVWDEINHREQKIIYISKNLEDRSLVRYPEFTKFVQKFENKVNFNKSASYLLHTKNFSKVRNLILDECKVSLQDDTGIPYRFFKEKGFNVSLFGKYAKPIRDFSHGFQGDLDKLYKSKQGIKAIDFTFGYHWWTDKTSILLFTKH